MARITSRQAQELMDAYAKVYEIKEEPAVETHVNETPVEDIQEAGRLKDRAGVQSLLNTKEKVGLKSGEKVTIEKGNVTDRQSSAGGSAGGGTAKVAGSAGGSAGGGSTQKSERPVSSAKQRWLDSQQSQKNLSNATKGYKFSRTDDGNIRADKVSGNNNNQQSTQSNNNTQSSSAPNGSGGRRTGIDGPKLMADLKNRSGDKVQSNNQTSQGSGQQPQSGVNRSQTVEKSGNTTTTTTKTSADSSTPAGAAAVKDAKAGFADRMAARRAARDGNTGGGGQAPQQGKGQAPSGGARAIGQKIGGAIGGGIDRGINRAKGGLSRLGALAGKAVGAAKSAAGAVASGAKRVAGGVADAATGNMTDFDKRGGKPQGVARVVAGGIDKLTGDRTDLDKRGVTPLNAGQRAQQQQKPAPQAQAKPAATRPVQGQQPAAKPVVTQQPAKKMGSIEKSNRAIHGDAKIDALKSKNAQFQAAKKSGNLAQYRKANPKMSGADRAKAMAKARIAAKNAPAPTPVNASYDFFDDTVQFLVSEGHAKDASEAMSIMSESEFIDAFNQEING